MANSLKILSLEKTYPDSNSQIKMPKLQMSAGKEYPVAPVITSGAAYPTVPQLVPVRIWDVAFSFFEKPKSTNFM
jgi:hypothetical protein